MPATNNDVAEQKLYLLTTIRTGSTYTLSVLDEHFRKYGWYGGNLGEYFATDGLYHRGFYRDGKKTYGIRLNDPRVREREVFYLSAKLDDEGKVRMQKQPYPPDMASKCIDEEAAGRQGILTASKFCHVFKLTPLAAPNLIERTRRNEALWAFLDDLGYKPIILKRRNGFAQLFSKVMLWGSRANAALQVNPIHTYDPKDVIHTQPIVYNRNHLSSLLEELNIISWAEAGRFSNATVLYYEDDILGASPQHLLSKLGHFGDCEGSAKLSIRNRYQGHPRDHIVNYDEMVADCKAFGLAGRDEFEKDFGSA